MPEFTCDHCGETFVQAWSDDEAMAEAGATFRPEELEDVAVVCEDCWRRMRRALPDLVARYSEQGL